ncbi:hypothetical protein [Phormidesmis priestleyi]
MNSRSRSHRPKNHAQILCEVLNAGNSGSNAVRAAQIKVTSENLCEEWSDCSNHTSAINKNDETLATQQKEFIQKKAPRRVPC